MRQPNSALQTRLPFRDQWGGVRKGAGRPRAKGRGRVPHRKRAEHRPYWPVLVTLRTVSRDLRSPFVFPTVRGAIASFRRETAAYSKGSADASASLGREKTADSKGSAGASASLCREKIADSKGFADASDDGSFRICEYTVQGDHIHLLVEASSSRALQRGLRGLSVRLAKRVNQLLFQKGRLIADRYHVRSLKSPRSVRNALVYVFGNFRKHGHARPGEKVDRFSSAPYFSAFSDFPRHGPTGGAHQRADAPMGAAPVEHPCTWLLAHGWRRHGLISVWEQPRETGRPKETKHD